MSKLGEMFVAFKVKTRAMGQRIIMDENGDTNFISIAIIIAIVIALAAAFMAFGPDLIDSIGQKANKFINDTAK